MNQTELARHDERGQSLVEVLAALAIMLLVMVGVLQLFTMGLLSYRVSTAQSEMTNKAQAVVEVIRMVNSLGLTANNGGILPLATSTRNLPVTSSDANWAFWGPAGFGIIQPDSKFRISYQITDDGVDWVVAVLVEPGTTGSTYLGPVGQKGIRYAARVPK